MKDDKCWTDLGRRAVTLGRSFARGDLHRMPARRVEPVLVTDDTGRLSQEFVTDCPEELAV